MIPVLLIGNLWYSQAKAYRTSFFTSWSSLLGSASASGISSSESCADSSDSSSEGGARLRFRCVLCVGSSSDSSSSCTCDALELLYMGSWTLYRTSSSSCRRHLDGISILLTSETNYLILIVIYWVGSLNRKVVVVGCSSSKGDAIDAFVQKHLRRKTPTLRDC